MILGIVFFVALLAVAAYCLGVDSRSNVLYSRTGILPGLAAPRGGRTEVPARALDEVKIRRAA